MQPVFALVALALFPLVLPSAALVADDGRGGLAQATVGETVSGCVSLPGGSSVPGAEVRVMQAGRTTTLVTDQNGCYRATDVPVGAIRVSVRCMAFAPEEREARMELGKALRFDFTLSLAPGAVEEPPLQITPQPGGSGAIVGCVADIQGNLETAAAIRLLDGAGKSVKSTIASDGCFDFRDVVPGAYSVSAFVNGVEVASRKSVWVVPLAVVRGDMSSHR